MSTYSSYNTQWGGGAARENQSGYSNSGGGQGGGDGRRDPHEVLGVSRDATPTQIRAAYRKLALRWHPDKVIGDEKAKAEASEKFSEIGAAYEILTRQASASADGTGGGGGEASHPSFAARQHQDSAADADAAAGYYHHQYQNYHEPPPTEFGNVDEFFQFGGMGGSGGFFQGTSPDFVFTDPFELFRNTFASEFDSMMGMGGGRRRGGGGSGGMGFYSQQQQQQEMADYQDPYGAIDPFDSFFSSFFSGGGRGGMGLLPGGMMQSMMMGGGSGGQDGAASTFTYSTSTNASVGGGRGGLVGGDMRSVTTTTQIVDGRQVTTTQTTVVHPDGRRETTIDLTGCDEDYSSLNQARLPTPSNNADHEGYNQDTIASAENRESCDGGANACDCVHATSTAQTRNSFQEEVENQERSREGQHKGQKRNCCDLTRCLSVCLPFQKRRRTESSEEGSDSSDIPPR